MLEDAPEPEEIARIKRKKVLTDEDIKVLNQWQWQKVFGDCLDPN